MKPIEFKEMNGIAAKDQSEYILLPMHRDQHEIISCWKLSKKELKIVQETGVIWLSLFQPSFARITPVLIGATNPFEHNQSQD